MYVRISIQFPGTLYYDNRTVRRINSTVGLYTSTVLYRTLHGVMIFPERLSFSFSKKYWLYWTVSYGTFDLYDPSWYCAYERKNTYAYIGTVRRHEIKKKILNE